VSCQARNSWLDSASVGAVRDAVSCAAPHLVGEVELNDTFLSSNPFWQRGTAWLGAQHVVKFAWSEAAAAELDRERRVVLALAGTPFRRWLPPIEATAERPVLIITRRVDGMPCAGTLLEDRATAAAVAQDLAQALATLHDPVVLAAVTRAVPAPPPPAPQAETGEIRDRLYLFVDPAHLPQIRQWCVWVDEVQGDLTGDHVLLHGDVHGYNLLVEAGRLRCVLDYDAASVGDHHFDFRYLPAIEKTIGFFCRVAEQYERRTRRAVDPAPVLAWHIRTVLGDALWRSEAGVPLPGGVTADQWIEEMKERIVQLAAWRGFDTPSGL
jgi:aminoglycoside phosphotransferase (APT) family kinase protein